MRNNKIKITALLTMTLIASSAFANDNDHLFGAPQPYISDLGNVEINFQTVNNFLPTKTNGPSTYAGKPIINAAVTNNSSNAITIECTGIIKPRICTGGVGITDCLWTDEANITVSDLSIIGVGVAAGAASTMSFTLTDAITTTNAGWGLEVYNTSTLSCLITDKVSGATIIKTYFIPVA
jgi:hypothetical protein